MQKLDQGAILSLLEDWDTFSYIFLNGEEIDCAEAIREVERADQHEVSGELDESQCLHITIEE